MQFIRSKEWWMNRIKDEPDAPISAGAFYAKQPLSLRIWHWLGFHKSFSEELFEWRNMEPPEEGFAPSAFHTETHVILDWKDRLRVLVTGHICVDVWTKTDEPVNRAKSRSEVAVLPPIQKSQLVRE
jgi:hypothetical protein